MPQHATVNGLVWASSHIGHDGSLHGLVVAKSFHVYKRPTTYVNWLVDSYTNRTLMKPNTLFPILFGENPLVEPLYVHKPEA